MRPIQPFSARPLVIAHRGASGTLPEQTLAAFDLAVDQGADAIELDVVPTADGVLVARHENELSVTTDVASHPAFAPRRTTRIVDGQSMSGWFVEDFTAADVRLLRARQRFSFRDHSHDDSCAVPTLDDVLEWLMRRRDGIGRDLGLFIELKHPAYFARAGLPMDELVIAALDRHGLNKSGAVLMSFDADVLKRLRRRTDVPIFQLLEEPPGDLTAIAAYADGIGPWKRLIVPTLEKDTDGAQAAAGRLAPPTSLIADAHAAGLFVCAWTFRDEPRYLAADYAGDPKREYEQFHRLEIDGVITDFPATASAVQFRRRRGYQ